MSMGQSRNEIAEGFEPAGPRFGVSSLREDRDADDAALDSRLATASADPEAAGAAVLARIGLRNQ